MWIQAIMGLLQMGQENTIRNQAHQLQLNDQLANVLFNKKKSYEQTLVILGMFVVVGLVLFLVIKD